MELMEQIRDKFVNGGGLKIDTLVGGILISAPFIILGIILLIIAVRKLIIFHRIKKNGIRTKATSTYDEEHQTVHYSYCADEQHYTVKRHARDNKETEIGRVTIYYDSKHPQNFMTDLDVAPWFSLVGALAILGVGIFGLVREIMPFIK